MYLLPKPKKLEIKENNLKSKRVNIKNLCDDVRIEKVLSDFPKDTNGVLLTVSAANEESEGYTLTILPDEIKIAGKSTAGAFYGIQTLKQIFENETVPCLYIEDAPDMKHRGFYHDVTRGKVPKVETLKKLIDTMAYYKMNSLQIYVEHTFPFKEFGNDVDKFGYLTVDEIKELDDYCYDNFVEFIPSIATFGHLYELLQKEEYKDLRTIDNYKDECVFWIERMRHHTIDPQNPKSFEIIKSLIDQYLPLFRTDKFNICCDETFDLKVGKHKDKDTSKLYVDFVKKIIDYLKSKGKKIMMWGDILLQHPERIKDLPDDIQFLNWHYSPNPKEEDFVVFENSGCEQIVCPGTGTWHRLIECIDSASKNICRMLDLGYIHNAVGMINTNWGDYGTPCSLELTMHGLILGAAKSWNKITEVNEEFTDSINELQYKNENAVKYLSILDNASEKISWKKLVCCYSNYTCDSGFDIDYPDKTVIENTVASCKSVIDNLKSQTWEKDEYRRELLVCAEGIIVMAELFAKLAGYEAYRTSVTSKWLSNYRKSWLKSNKESELNEIEKMFNTLEAL